MRHLLLKYFLLNERIANIVFYTQIICPGVKKKYYINFKSLSILTIMPPIKFYRTRKYIETLYTFKAKYIRKIKILENYYQLFEFPY